MPTSSSDGGTVLYYEPLGSGGDPVRRTWPGLSADVDGCGHHPFVEQPEHFEALVREFFGTERS
jgi:pimeloyl-ACP methyl ester carboxylesterase